MGDGDSQLIPLNGPPCLRCRGALRLMTIMPRRTDHPLYYIYGCRCCGKVEWIAEQTATS